MAGEEKPGVLIRDRERVAVQAVARAKVPLEVGRPQIVRRSRVNGYCTRMLDRWPTPSTFLNQMFAAEQITRRADRGPRVDVSMPRPEIVQDLSWAPGRMGTTGLDEATPGSMRCGQ